MRIETGPESKLARDSRFIRTGIRIVDLDAPRVSCSPRRTRCENSGSAHVPRPTSHVFSETHCLLLGVARAVSRCRHRGIKRRREPTRRCFRRGTHFFYGRNCIVWILDRLGLGQATGTALMPRIRAATWEAVEKAQRTS